MEEKSLLGKVALVTGGSQGIGRSIVKRFLEEGATVIIADIDEREFERNFKKNTENLLFIKADLTNSVDIDKIYKLINNKFNKLNILVNNAGKAAASGLEEVDDNDWQSDIDLKLMAAVRTCRAVIPLMRDRGGGAIVNATIGGGKAPPAKVLPTTVTRAAGINLTKALANEYACVGIRVNTVCIGLIKSEQWVRKVGVDDVEDFYIDLAKCETHLRYPIHGSG